MVEFPGVTHLNKSSLGHQTKVIKMRQFKKNQKRQSKLRWCHLLLLLRHQMIKVAPNSQNRSNKNIRKASNQNSIIQQGKLYTWNRLSHRASKPAIKHSNYLSHQPIRPMLQMWLSNRRKRWANLMKRPHLKQKRLYRPKKRSQRTSMTNLVSR